MADIIRVFDFVVNFQEDKFERKDGSTDVITIVESDNKSTKFKFYFEEELQDRTNVLVKIKHNIGFAKDYVLCIKNKEAELVLTNSITIAGFLKMTISFIGNDNEILTPAQFQNKILVKEAITGETPIPEDDSKLLEGLISQVNLLNDDTKKAVEGIENTFDQINKKLDEKIETINERDNEQDGKITLNKESIKQIQAENERLREDIKSIATIGEASGENIHVEDSSDARCKIEICGNHKQEIREGYNKLDSSEFVDGSQNGVTLKVNLDGTLTLNGTATADTTFRILRTQKSIVGKENLKVIINQLENEVKTGTIRLVCQDESYGNTVYSQIGTSTFGNNLKEGITYNIFSLVVSSGTICNNLKLGLVISENKTDYEQYGASPSFAYPSSVKAVGDVKNILNMSNAKGGTSGGITCNMIADGSYTYKGTASSKAINIWLLGSYNNKTSIFRLEPGTYYIDGVVLFDGNNVLANPDTAKIFTFINAHDITGVRVLDAVLENTYDETNYPIIAKIDHEIPWVPYEMGYIQVNEFNKNYLSTIPQTTFSLQGIQTTFDGEKFICKGTAMYNYFNLVPKRVLHHFKAGTYTFSSNMFEKGRACIRFYYEDGTADTYYSNINTKKISFTLKKDAYAYFLMVDGLTVGGGDVIDCIIKLQLEDGNTSTEIVKAENQEFVVDVQQPLLEGDTFVRQDGKWYEKHNWKTMSFDGQNMASQAGGNFADFKENGNIARVFEIKDLLISSIRNDIFCDKLPRQADSMWNGKSTGIQSWQGQNKILISLPFDDVEKKYGQKLTVDNYVTAFYMCLQDEVPIISYPLAEPELVECTEVQINVLDEIYNKAHTYKNITNISAESAEVNPIVSLKYLKDVETEHNKLQAQIDEIKQLLSTTETSALLVNNLEKDLRMEVE